MASLASLMLGSGQAAESAEDYIARMEQAFEPAEEEDARELKWRRENGLCERTGRRPELCCCGGPGCIGETIESETKRMYSASSGGAGSSIAGGETAGATDEDDELAGPPIPPKKLARHHAAWRDFVEADEIGPLVRAFERGRRAR